MNDTALLIIGLFFIMISVGFMYFYHTYREEETRKIIPVIYKKRYAFLAVIELVIAVIVFLYSFYLKDLVFLKAFMNAEVMLWLTTVGYIDWKEKIIPNAMIFTGIIFWAVLSLLEIFIAQTMWQKVLLYSLFGGGFCGGILFLIAIITKSALGMGDVKMFFVIGLLYGLTNTYVILFFSILIMAIVSIVLLLMKKVTRKTTVPMAPFVTLGFGLCVFMGM